MYVCFQRRRTPTEFPAVVRALCWDWPEHRSDASSHPRISRFVRGRFQRRNHARQVLQPLSQRHVHWDDGSGCRKNISLVPFMFLYTYHTCLFLPKLCKLGNNICCLCKCAIHNHTCDCLFRQRPRRGRVQCPCQPQCALVNQSIRAAASHCKRCSHTLHPPTEAQERTEVQSHTGMPSNHLLGVIKLFVCRMNDWEYKLLFQYREEPVGWFSLPEQYWMQRHGTCTDCNKAESNLVDLINPVNWSLNTDSITEKLSVAFKVVSIFLVLLLVIAFLRHCVCPLWKCAFGGINKRSAVRSSKSFEAVLVWMLTSSPASAPLGAGYGSCIGDESSIHLL